MRLSTRLELLNLDLKEIIYDLEDIQHLDSQINLIKTIEKLQKMHENLHLHEQTLGELRL